MKNNIGSNIRKLRERRAVTQNQLAQALNVSFQAVSKWELGVTLPDTLLLPEIARYFGVTIDDLFSETVQAYENLAIRLFSVYEHSHKQDDFIRADQEFKRLLANGTATANDLRTYGILYQYHARFCIKKALSLFQKALGQCGGIQDEMYYRIVNQRTCMLASIGRGDECIGERREALRDDPENPQNYLSLAAACFASGQYNQAQVWTEEGIRKFPGFAGLHVCAGDLAEQAGNTDQALRCWDQALALDNRWLDAMYSKAFCYQRTRPLQRSIHPMEPDCRRAGSPRGGYRGPVSTRNGPESGRMPGFFPGRPARPGRPPIAACFPAGPSPWAGGRTFQNTMNIKYTLLYLLETSLPVPAGKAPAGVRTGGEAPPGMPHRS